MRRTAAILAFLASAVFVAGCGNTSNGNPIVIVSGNIAYFIVTASGNRDTVSVLPGTAVPLSGQAFDASLNPLALVGDTTWTSRDPNIATVNSHGVVTTIATGSVWVIGSFLPKQSPTPYADSVLVQVLGQT